MPHVEGKDRLDPAILRAACVGAAARLADDPGADLAKHPDSRAHTTVDGPLHQRHEDELRREHGERNHGHQWIQVNHVTEHAQEEAALQKRLRDADAHEGTDRFGLIEHEGDLDALCLGQTPLIGVVNVQVGRPGVSPLADDQGVPRGCDRPEAGSCKGRLKKNP